MDKVDIELLENMYDLLVGRYGEDPMELRMVKFRRAIDELQRGERETLPITDIAPEDFPFGGMPKQDRYKVEGSDEDYVDITYRQMPWERFIGAMQWTIGKYFDRFGRKDDIVAEAYKIKDYANRFYEKVVEEAAKRKNT